jgi:hypothetical protein
VVTKKNITKTKLPNGDILMTEPNSPSVVLFKADALDFNPEPPPHLQTSQNNIHDIPVNERWIPWGDNDNYPLNLLRKISKLGVAETGIDQNADLHFGAGVEWFKKIYKPEGKIIFQPMKIPQWEEFIKRSNFLVHFSDIIQSMETFYISFVEFILTKNKKNIYSVRCLDTPFCRLAKKNNKGKISKMYFVHDIEEGQSNFQEIPLFDSHNPTKFGKFVLVIKYRCFGMPYYTKPNINTVFENGWADVAMSVPAYIKSIYNNQASLKYFIKVPISALRAKYKVYDSKTEAEQLELQEEMKSNIDNTITGKERAGISVFSVFDDDETTGITIEPIKNFLDSSSEIPNNFAANSEILFSLSVDPSSLGMGIPGGKTLSGSGSDKRESRANKQKNLKRERLITLQVLSAIQKIIPEFPQDVEPHFIDADNSQTLDENPTGTQNTVV